MRPNTLGPVLACPARGLRMRANSRMFRSNDRFDVASGYPVSESKGTSFWGAGGARKLFLSSLVFGAALFSPVLFAGFSFTSDEVAEPFGDDSQAYFGFNLTQPGAVDVVTLSYAGGTNHAGQVIPSGGFDPIVSVFDSTGSLVAYNDNGSSVVDPVTGLSYDSLLSLDLSDGDYTVVLTEHDNFSAKTLGIYSGNVSGGDIALGPRTSDWAIDILGVDDASFLGLFFPGVAGTAPAPPSPTGQEMIDEAMQGIAVNGNTSSTARVIGNDCPRSKRGSRFQKDCSPVVGGALTRPETQANVQASAALVAVTAEQATAPLASSRASLSTQLQNLSTRLAALRSGAMGISISLPRGGAASADDDSMILFGEERLGVFVNGNYSRADKDKTSNEVGFDVDSWAITAGVDYRFREDLVIGIAGGYGKADTDIDNNGGKLDADAYSVSLYGTYYRGENWYVDGILTYGQTDYDQDRNINYQIDLGPVRTVVDQTASADYDGKRWSAAFGGGYSFFNGPWTYGPMARLQYVSADVDGYTEKMSNPNASGGAWATSLASVDQTSFTSAIGGNVSRAVSTSWGVLLPQLHLSWVHEFEDDGFSINGFFVQDPARSVFRISSDEPDSNYFNARLAVSAQFAGGKSGFLYYNKILGYRDLNVDSFGAGVRLTF